ncbi:MAG: WYL domain-containing protein [Ruthenibacterium sp.]
MAKSESQKLKLLYLADILRRETDETHTLRVQDMIEKLAALEISAERKSIYDDLAALERYGYDIVRTQDKSIHYALTHRDFELPELKLLVDAVQSSKFLSARKSRALIHKLEGLASRYEAQALQRQVYVTNRVKSMNESVYYSIDTLHTAINADRKIAFQYFEWTVQKTMAFKHGGALYSVSPYALMRDDENYYCIGYDAASDKIKNYRVDKMYRITVTDTPRDGKTHFKNFDIAAYTQKMFGMFGGTEEAIEIVFANRLAGVVLDRFGKECMLFPIDDTHFKLHINAIVSPLFLGWVAGFGAEARIVAPQSVAAQLTTLCKNISAQYPQGDL